MRHMQAFHHRGIVGARYYALCVGVLRHSICVAHASPARISQALLGADFVSNLPYRVLSMCHYLEDVLGRGR